MTPIDFWTVVFAGAIALCAPLLFAGIGEILLERTGGFNVGIEGMMLLGAAGGVVGAGIGGFWTGLAVGLLCGALLGVLLGLATAWGGADIVIVGIAIGLLGTGLSIFVYQGLNPSGSVNTRVETQPAFVLPFVDAIPVIGRGLANAGALFFLAVLVVAATWWFLRYTRLGLRLRAVGDDEQVAATRGIPTRRYRLGAAIAAGALAGLGGAAVPLASIGIFSPGMTGGTGFIALAVVIIARRTPGGLLAGALVFSFFNSLALLAQTQGLGLPIELYQSLPYLVTLAVLVVVSRQLWLRERRVRLAAVTTQDPVPDSEGSR